MPSPVKEHLSHLSVREDAYDPSSNGWISPPIGGLPNRGCRQITLTGALSKMALKGLLMRIRIHASAVVISNKEGNCLIHVGETKEKRVTEMADTGQVRMTEKEPQSIMITIHRDVRGAIISSAIVKEIKKFMCTVNKRDPQTGKLLTPSVTAPSSRMTA
jgi:hypothetical protein